MRQWMICSLLLLVPSTTYAIGICEDTPRLYDGDVSYSPVEKRFAFTGRQAWCQEDEQNAEERGELRFIELRDLEGQVVSRLASAHGKDRARFEKVVGQYEEVTSGRIEATLRARGFKPLPQKPSNAACRVQTAWTKSDEKQNGFPAGTVTVSVVAGHKQLAQTSAGVAARLHRGEVTVRAAFLPAEKEVVVLVRVPQCSGGPPPGAFGPDDSGSCYRDDVVVVRRLKGDELAPCF